MYISTSVRRRCTLFSLLPVPLSTCFFIISLPIWFLHAHSYFYYGAPRHPQFVWAFPTKNDASPSLRKHCGYSAETHRKPSSWLTAAKRRESHFSCSRLFQNALSPPVSRNAFETKAQPAFWGKRHQTQCLENASLQNGDWSDPIHSGKPGEKQCLSFSHGFLLNQFLSSSFTPRLLSSIAARSGTWITPWLGQMQSRHPGRRVERRTEMDEQGRQSVGVC